MTDVRRVASVTARLSRLRSHKKFSKRWGLYQTFCHVNCPMSHSSPVIHPQCGEGLVHQIDARMKRLLWFVCSDMLNWNSSPCITDLRRCQSRNAPTDSGEEAECAKSPVARDFGGQTPLLRCHGSPPRIANRSFV